MVNVELKFKYSNIAVFRIVEFKNKKYILDPTSIKGKSYFFGLLPKEVSADMVELSPSNDSFRIKSKTPIGSSTALVIMVQPFVAISYRLIKDAFIDWCISQQFFLKLGVFAFSLFLSYLMAVFYEKVRLESLNQEFPKIVNDVDLFLNPKVNE